MKKLSMMMILKMTAMMMMMIIIIIIIIIIPNDSVDVALNVIVFKPVQP